MTKKVRTICNSSYDLLVRRCMFVEEHRSVGRYFISTRYPSNDKYGGPSFSITNHNIYLYYWLLWIADIFKWQHEMIYWVNTYTSQLNELGILARQ